MKEKGKPALEKPSCYLFQVLARSRRSLGRDLGGIGAVGTVGIEGANVLSTRTNRKRF